MLRITPTTNFCNCILQARVWRIVLMAAIALVAGSAIAATATYACPVVAGQLPEVSGTKAVILEAGFEAITAEQQWRTGEQPHLWLRLENVPTDVRFVVAESVWGAGPRSMAGMWGRALPIRQNLVLAYPNSVETYRDQPFTLGLRVRYIFEDGRVSLPSLPITINHASIVHRTTGIRVDQIVMVLLCMTLLFLWSSYRTSVHAHTRIRIAAFAALISLLMLAIAPVLPWMAVHDPQGRFETVECYLGDEVQCATYAPDAGPNPISRSEVSHERRIDLIRWAGASSTLRASLIVCMVFLMPMLIWLLVVPGLRVAQGAMLLGTSVAFYTFLSGVFYRLTTPSWMDVHYYQTFDLLLATTTTIFLSAACILFCGCGRRSLGAKISIPKVRVRSL